MKLVFGESGVLHAGRTGVIAMLPAGTELLLRDRRATLTSPVTSKTLRRENSSALTSANSVHLPHANKALGTEEEEKKKRAADVLG